MTVGEYQELFDVYQKYRDIVENEVIDDIDLSEITDFMAVRTAMENAGIVANVIVRALSTEGAFGPDGGLYAVALKSYLVDKYHLSIEITDTIDYDKAEEIYS